MSKSKVLFAGCSLSMGHGLPGEKSNPNIWTTKLAGKIFPDSEVINIAEAGHSNDSIFLDTLVEITKNSYEYVIVEWTETSRINYNIGLELYNTKSRLMPDYDYHLYGGRTIKGNWLFKNILMNLDDVLNEHWAILRMVKYLNILAKAQQRNGKIFFVNGKGSWTKEYFNKRQSWQDSDEYTKKNILEIDRRADEDIALLYNKIHSDYENAGGIQEELWFNLYESIHSLKIDNASPVDEHPGVLSQDMYAFKFAKRFSELNKK